MDYQIEEMIKTMKKLQDVAKRQKLPKLKPKAQADGLRVSSNTCRQQEYVFPTPLAKNILVAFGDLTQSQDADGKWVTEKLKCGTETKAVQWLNEVVKKCLSTYNGEESHDYPSELPIDNRRYYDIDCWNGWKEKVWDIQPGQAEERKKRFREYTNPHTNISVDGVVKLLQKDPVLRKAVLVEFEMWPRTTADRDIKNISDPFMSKGTGVSYPFYRNDRTVVDPADAKEYGIPWSKDLTYGKLCIEILTRVYKQGGLDALLRFAVMFLVCTGYPRNQRGKGRALIAMARLVNLVVNMVNSPEMEQWKNDKFNGVAFQDEDTIREILGELLQWAIDNGVEAYNIDYSSWDYNLGEGWLCLQDAMRYMKASDQFTRQLIEFRYVCNRSAWFVDGPNKSVRPIFGRMMSGYDDTTLGNTCAQRVISRYCAMMAQKDRYDSITKPRKGKDLIAVGDDLCLLIDSRCIPEFVRTSNKVCKTVVHEDEKHAKGVMFIQWRCFKLDGKVVIAYNWPRVLRSMMSKEDAKHLGRGGWTISFYQQLGKLLQVPDFGLNIVVNIAAACDQYHLSLDTPVSEILRWVEEEDKLRVAEGSANRQAKMKRKNTTAERLYNGNPNLPGVVERDGRVVLDHNYFEDVQKQLKAVYDPQFLRKLGLQEPDLSKVHFD